MKPVKTMPRFQCDYCKKRSTRSVMEIHERRCFRNPNRFCDHCNNTGEIEIFMADICDGGYGGSFQQPCEYCEKFDAEMLRQIKEREAMENL